MPQRRDLPDRAARRHRRRRPPRRRAPRHRRRGGIPRRGDPRPGLDGGLLDRRGDDRRRPVAGLGGEPGARGALGEHPGAVRRPRPRRGRPASRSRRINLRTQTFDMARTVYEAAAAADVAAVILELARSEQTYTFQRPIDYATSVLAGAIAAGWQGPVFIQGDHYQFNAKKYAADPEAMTEEIRRACRLAVDAGYRNIDIDSSTLVDLSKPNVDEQQRENYVRAAELTALIRTLETDGVTISVGGEIGEVGTQNSTVEELRAYLDGYRRELEARAPGAAGISKVSVQTGHVARRRAAARRRRGRGQARLRGPARARRRRPRVRAGRRRPARRVDPARRAVPPLPGGRDRRDPPRDRVPERALRAPRLPRGAPPRDRGVGASPTRRRAEARPDRPAVRLHDPQEGARAVQAPAVGARDRRTRSSPPSAARSPTCSPSCGSTTRARWSSGTSSRSSSTGRSPTRLRGAVAAR